MRRAPVLSFEAETLSDFQEYVLENFFCPRLYLHRGSSDWTVFQHNAFASLCVFYCQRSCEVEISTEWGSVTFGMGELDFALAELRRAVRAEFRRQVDLRRMAVKPLPMSEVHYVAQ